MAIAFKTLLCNRPSGTLPGGLRFKSTQWKFSLPDKLRYTENSLFLPGRFVASPVTFYHYFYKTSVFRCSYLFKKSKKIKHYYHGQKQTTEVAGNKSRIKSVNSLALLATAICKKVFKIFMPVKMYGLTPLSVFMGSTQLRGKTQWKIIWP